MADNVPKIRFPGFTEPWEQRKFKDLVFKSGKKNKKNLPYESFSITNESGFVSQNEQFENGGTMKDADKSMYIIVSPNSFAYNPARINVGSIGYQALGKNVIVSSLYEVFKTSHEVDDHFLWYWFKSDHFKRLVESLQEGGVRLYFYFDKLQKGELWLPPIEEQRKIGGYFKSVDNLITLHQRKLDDLKKLKSGLLQKMFPKAGETVPEVRFPEFTGDWEQRKLGNLFFQTNETVNPKTSNLSLWSLTVESGLTPKPERYDRSAITKKEDQYKMVHPGEIVFNPMNMTIGAIGMNKNSFPIAVSGYYITMKESSSNNKTIDPCFFSEWMCSPNALKLYKNVATGSLIEKQRVQFSTFSKIRAMFPKYEEQKKIGQVFDALDDLITLHQRKLDDLKKLKQGLLQQMLV
ncbi:restriction endonuclease subunit S [Faecalibaculum rodentium]|uniref:restriction endonuclease subunit S n=1 Tax=Faecalibaculum rodentium TaxID=1702221 RepID=UPI00256EF93C|nr:restriction endonuclease subunit S [Faecalibaculum rodentium]